MKQQPRRNQAIFYRYPVNRITAIIDDEAHLDSALESLEEAGVNLSKVNVLSDADGAELLDRTGIGHGLPARVLRLLQRTAYEGEALSAHESALKEGRHIIYVLVRSDVERNTVVPILRASAGHYLLHFHRWTVEEVRF